MKPLPSQNSKSKKIYLRDLSLFPMSRSSANCSYFGPMQWRSIRILKGRRTPGILSWVSGNLEQAKEAISFGCLIAIWPTITYSKYLQKLVKNLPLDAIAFETDSPTVSPSNAPLGSLAHHVPIPGIASTEPVHITITAKEVAKIKDIALAEVEQVTTESAKELFHLTI